MSNEKRTPDCLGYMSGMQQYPVMWGVNVINHYISGSLLNNKYNGKSLNKDPKVYVEMLVTSLRKLAE